MTSAINVRTKHNCLAVCISVQIYSTVENHNGNIVKLTLSKLFLFNQIIILSAANISLTKIFNDSIYLSNLVQMRNTY